MAPPSTVREDGTKPCTRCACVKPLDAFYTTGKKKDGSPKYNSWCRGCAKQKQASYHRKIWGPERLQFSAHKRTQSVRAFMVYLLSKARRRNDCGVTADDMEALWSSQSGRCALTGWHMTMVLGKGSVPTNASIDRIDSRGSYTLGNVQLVCRAVNVAKSDLPQAAFIRLCSAVVENHNENVQDARLAA